MRALLQNYVDGLIAVALAGVGGTIRVLENHRTGKQFPGFWVVFVEIITAGFSGLLVETLLHKWGVDSDTKIVVVAISGYASREVIELLRYFTTGVLGIMLKKKNKLFVDESENGTTEK